MKKKEIPQEKSSKRGAPKKIEIRSKEELSRLVKREKEQKIKMKLSVLNLIATCNMSPREVSKILGIAHSPIILGKADWNKEGYEGLKEKPPSKGKPPQFVKQIRETNWMKKGWKSSKNT